MSQLIYIYATADGMIYSTALIDFPSLRAWLVSVKGCNLCNKNIITHLTYLIIYVTHVFQCTLHLDLNYFGVCVGVLNVTSGSVHVKWEDYTYNPI